MSKHIIVPNGVLDYAQQFFAPSDRAMPRREAVRDALVGPARCSIEAGLVPGSPDVSWSPPEPIGDHTQLGVLRVWADWVVKAHAPEVPGRGLLLSLRKSGRSAVCVFAVQVTNPPVDAADVLDPISYCYEETAGGDARVSWLFNRRAREARIDVSRPLGSRGPCLADLIALYHAGERVDAFGGRVVVDALAHGGPPAVVRRGRWLELHEDAHVVEDALEVPTVHGGFDRLVERLPLSPSLARLRRKPDSRLR